MYFNSRILSLFCCTKTKFVKSPSPGTERKNKKYTIITAFSEIDLCYLNRRKQGWARVGRFCRVEYEVGRRVVCRYSTACKTINFFHWFILVSGVEHPGEVQ